MTSKHDESANEGKTSIKNHHCSWYLDALVLGIPVLIVFTVPASSYLPAFLLVAMLSGSAILHVMCLGMKDPDWNNRWQEDKAWVLVQERHKSFVAAFKGATMFVTCFAILAVDFSPFDRAYAKTEAFGTSLMDLGVGMFVFSSGITSRWARGRELQCAAKYRRRKHRRSGSECSDEDDDDDVVVEDKNPTLLEQLPINLPAVVLGLARFVVMRSVNYQEHASEYGAQWNFYLTLAGVWCLAACTRRCVHFVLTFALPALRYMTIGASNDDTQDDEDDDNDVGNGSRRISSGRGRDYGRGWVLGLAGASMIAYQVTLQCWGLGDWVITAPRFFDAHDDSNDSTGVIDKTGNNALKHDFLRLLAHNAWIFFQANREGLLAVVPLACLFVYAEELGRRALWPEIMTQQRRKVVAAWAVQAAALFTLALGFWLAFGASAALLQPPSRRLANLTFVLLSLACGTTVLSLFLAADLVAVGGVPLPSQASRTLVGMGRWPLLTFVGANLLTGIVNMCFDTLRASLATTRTILILYMVLVAAIPSAADFAFGADALGPRTIQAHHQKRTGKMK